MFGDAKNQTWIPKSKTPKLKNTSVLFGITSKVGAVLHGFTFQVRAEKETNSYKKRKLECKTLVFILS